MDDAPDLESPASEAAKRPVDQLHYAETCQLSLMLPASRR